MYGLGFEGEGARVGMETDEAGAIGDAPTMTYREAAKLFLRRRGPMHYQDLTGITDIIVRSGLVRATGTTPAILRGRGRLRVSDCLASASCTGDSDDELLPGSLASCGSGNGAR